jgi:hypothetical protein
VRRERSRFIACKKRVESWLTLPVCRFAAVTSVRNLRCSLLPRSPLRYIATDNNYAFKRERRRAPPIKRGKQYSERSQTKSRLTGKGKGLLDLPALECSNRASLVMCFLGLRSANLQPVCKLPSTSTFSKRIQRMGNEAPKASLRAQELMLR